MGVDELSTIDESELHSKSEHGGEEHIEYAEDFIDTGMPEPGARTSPV